MTQMMVFFACHALANGASLLVVQRKLIAAQWALIAANEKLMSLGEKPFHPKDFGGTDAS
jgi:hypothetical protein